MVRSRKASVHPAVKWLRTTGITAELFGWGGVLLADWFWPGVAAIYVGFLLLSIDLCIERALSKSWRTLGVVVILSLAAAFSIGIVFFNAALDIKAFTVEAQYPPGSVIAGLAWGPKFTELQVWLTNPTDRNYEDLNLVIRPVMPVAAAAQLTDVPNVSIEDSRGIVSRFMAGENSNLNVLPLVLVATDAGYRLRCPRLAAKTSIKVVLALCDVKWSPKPPDPTRSPEQKMRDEDYLVRAKEDDFSTYWWGYKGFDHYTARPTSSEDVLVEGSYVSTHRAKFVKARLNVGGLR